MTLIILFFFIIFIVAIDFIVQTIRDIIDRRTKEELILIGNGFSSIPVSPIYLSMAKFPKKQHRKKRIRHKSDSKEDISYNRLHPQLHDMIGLN